MTREQIFDTVKAEYEKLMDMPMGGDASKQIARINGQVVGMIKAFRIMGYITMEEACDMIEELI